MVVTSRCFAPFSTIFDMFVSPFQHHILGFILIYIFRESNISISNPRTGFILIETGDR